MIRKKVVDVGSFEVIAGEPWEQSFRLNTRPTPSTKVPEDITGWSGWRSDWRPHLSSDLVVELTVEVDNDESVLTVVADTAETRLMLSYGTVGVFDLQGVDPDGKLRTRLRGTTTQVGDATR